MTYRPETLAVHAGQEEADPATNARAVPIYQTTSYVFNDTEHAANLFALAEPGNIYTRIMNPTQSVFEERMAQLEGGVGALATASGSSAITYAVLNLTYAGDNIVAVSTLYGGTYALFAHTLPQFGIEVRFVDPEKPEELAAAVDEKTKLVFAETVGNPKINVVDIAAWAEASHALGLPLIVDNTAPTPYLSRVLDLGADVAVHSATKYIGGHGTSIGGVIVDGGNFDWGANPARQPLLNQPDPSYHGAVWVEAVKPLGPIAYIIKARVTLLRDLGAALSPFNAFQTLQGLETLPLRIREHSRNAQAVAEHLAKHPAVAKVIHPSQQTGEARRRADTYLKGGFGGLLGFELKGGLEAGKRFIDALQLFYHVANIGDARSLAIHPASTTHSQLTGDEQAASGVSPGYVRLSIGIEHIDDILADLDQALTAAG